MNGIHDGHRERLRRQFLTEGFQESVPPHKLLEMLLFYAIPRKDTNETAHLLIEKFGSFSGVFDASVQDLITVPGITEYSACLLKLIMPIARKYLNDKECGTVCSVANRNEAGKYMLQKFVGLTVETIFLLCLDNRGKVLACVKLAEGDEISVCVSARTVVEQVLKTHATAVVIAHNHPRGFAFPSSGDVRVTTEISAALYHIGVQFIDHIIVAEGDYISMAQSEEYKNLFY